MTEWVTAVRQELGLEDTVDADALVDKVLDLTADVAHGVSRPAAPVTAYLLGLAAVFPLTGMGLAAYFACLAIGYVTGPFLLAVARVVLVVGIGWTALQWGGGLIGISLASAAAFALFGAGVFLLARRRFNALARG